jgi:HAD superfamily phosphoserine phosphatase-like hydrolase
MMTAHTKHYLFASDFDQTLSFHDSGLVLAELLGVRNFEQKVAGLAQSHLVQQGAELAYLIRHDPEFRGVRREHLVEAGRRVRLKAGISELVQLLEGGFDSVRFSFFVVSAAPREVVASALSGIVSADHIFGTELEYDASGEVQAVKRVPAGYGKVAVLEELEQRMNVPPHRIIYVGDGSSDVHVMLHVNNRDGHTIAVSENRQLARIAHRIVLSDNAFTTMLPVLEQVLRWPMREIHALFEANGFALQEWERARTDRVSLTELSSLPIAS